MPRPKSSTPSRSRRLIEFFGLRRSIVGMLGMAVLGAFVLRGLKEFGEPTRKAVIMDLAPEDRKAGMFGLYYLVRDVVVLAAAFGGAFLWRASPGLNLLVASAFGAMGTVWFALRGRDLPAGGEMPAER